MAIFALISGIVFMFICGFAVIAFFGRNNAPAVGGGLGQAPATPGRRPVLAAPRLANGTLNATMDGVTAAFWWSVMSVAVLFVFSLGCALGKDYDGSVFNALLQWWPLMLSTAAIWVMAGVYHEGDSGTSITLAYISTAAWLLAGLLSGIDWYDHLSWPQLKAFHDLVAIFPWNDQIDQFVVYLMKASFSWTDALKVITGMVYLFVAFMSSIAWMPTHNGWKVPWFAVFIGLGGGLFWAIWL